MDAVEAASRLAPVVEARKLGRLQPPEAGPHSVLSRIAWLYPCLLRPYLVKALAIAMVAVSVAVIWSEGTLGLGWTTESPFAAVCLQPSGLPCVRLLKPRAAFSDTIQEINKSVKFVSARGNKVS